MTMSTENMPARPLEGSAKSRPGRELVVETFFAPLANLVVRALLPLRVPPPGVVLANAGVGLVAAFVLVRGELVLAALLLQLKTVLDNVDGQLARASGRVSLVGRYLDTEADLVVNAVLFAALASTIGAPPWVALAAFVSVTLVLSTSFNVAELHRAVHGDSKEPPQASGGRVERGLELVYRAVFSPQDRVLRSFSSRRLERLLDAGMTAERSSAAGLAYYDRFTVTVLANLGLSTQLVVLGICLAFGEPVAYLWLAHTGIPILVVLQLRRERLARSALRSVRLARPRRAA